LVLLMDREVSSFALRLDRRVWEVSFPAGIVDADSLPAGFSAVQEDGRTRLRVEPSVGSLIGAEVRGTCLTLTFGSEPAGESQSGYRIGTSDVVSVLVYKNPDLSGDLVVGTDGTITMPLVGQVEAAGKTARELEVFIRDALAADFLVDPQVQVTVKSYESQYVYVTGAVQRATRVALRPSMTLKGVLSEAGVALLPGQEVVLSRTGGGGATVSLGADGLEADDAPRPADGDVLTVQQPSFVFIQGEVRRPSRLTLLPGMTLLQAIAVAEGLTDWASRKDVKILRKTGERTDELTYDLRRLQEGRDPDPELRAGDLIIVKRRFL